MGRLKLGVALASFEMPSSGEAPGWESLRNAAIAAEDVGFDTVWAADELIWETSEESHDMGWWEAVALLGAVAASTRTIEVGSWVLSALHRNPGVTVRAVETLDEISGGRFIFGFGSGHAGRQGESFGFPPNYTVSRYEEALDVVMPLIRDGAADYAGSYHTAVRQPNHPRGPQGSGIPIMLGGHGPRTVGIAVDRADIWSAFATTSNEASAFGDLMALVDKTCSDRDRDPESLGRSVGISVHRSDLASHPAAAALTPFVGTVDEIVRELEGFADLGFTRVELMGPYDRDTVEQLAPVVDAAEAI